MVFTDIRNRREEGVRRPGRPVPASVETWCRVAAGGLGPLILQAEFSVWATPWSVNISEDLTMKTARGIMSIVNGRLVDGTGGTRSTMRSSWSTTARSPTRARPEQHPRSPGGPRIDAHGGTIMPGLVEAHFHPTYFDVAELADLDIKYPVEFITILASCNARLRSSAATPRPAVAAACTTSMSG